MKKIYTSLFILITLFPQASKAQYCNADSDFATAELYKQEAKYDSAMTVVFGIMVQYKGCNRVVKRAKAEIENIHEAAAYHLYKKALYCCTNNKKEFGFALLKDIVGVYPETVAGRSAAEFLKVFSADSLEVKD